MNKSYFLILFISSFIFCCFLYEQQLHLQTIWKRDKKNHFLNEKYKNLLLQTDSNKYSALFYSLMTGDKTFLNKETKEEFKQMGLMHLLTPSGLHLSSLIIIFKFFPKRFQLILLFLISIPIFSLKNYYSIKRVLIFKFCTRLFDKNFKYKNEYAFILTFVLDILLGNFQEGVLSSVYSFLFWGTILFHKGNFWGLNYKLFFNLILTSFISSQKVNIISLFLNSLVSSLFTILYPILFINFWFPYFNFQTYISIKVIQSFGSTISYANSLIPPFIPPFLIVLIFFILVRDVRMKRTLLFTCLLSACFGNIDNLKDNFTNKKYILSPKGNSHCNWKLKDFYYDIRCKKRAR